MSAKDSNGRKYGYKNFLTVSMVENTDTRLFICFLSFLLTIIMWGLTVKIKRKSIQQLQIKLTFAKLSFYWFHITSKWVKLGGIVT